MKPVFDKRRAFLFPISQKKLKAKNISNILYFCPLYLLSENFYQNNFFVPAIYFSDQL